MMIRKTIKDANFNWNEFILFDFPVLFQLLSPRCHNQSIQALFSQHSLILVSL